jgi:transcriptional regulator GlxA family with amidase domain
MRSACRWNDLPTSGTIADVHKDPAKPHHVVVLALPNVVAFDLTIATHVFAHATGDRYRMTLASLRSGPVQTTSSFAINADAGLAAVAEADTVLVPGFAFYRLPGEFQSADNSANAQLSGSSPNSRSSGNRPNSSNFQNSLKALKVAHDRGARIASICTGAFALAAAGLLDGKRATTHWMHAAELQRRFPAVTVDPSVLYFDEGSVLTSAGIAAGLDLCLHIVGRDHGERVAIDVARRMVTPLHRAGGQAQFIPAAPSTVTGEMRSVLDWAQRHLHEPLTVADLARRALQAPRTFNRAFQAQLGMSPHAWLTERRLRAACELLEDPGVPIEDIARRTGMGSATNFRLHFRRAYATTPTAYRATFRG